MTQIAHYSVYILLCANGNYYTGYTNDLTRRYQEHLLGTGKCKYTRSFKPLSIVRHWLVFGDKSTALKVEKYIKSMNRKNKIALINTPQQLLEIFPSVKVGGLVD